MQTFLPYAGFADTAQELDKRRLGEQRVEAIQLPPWLGDADFHRSHRSALLRKDPAHYRPFFPDVPDDLPYVWPASGRQRRTFDDR